MTHVARNSDEYESIAKGHYIFATRNCCTLVVVVNGQGRQLLLLAYDHASKAFCYFYTIKRGASDVDVTLLQTERISEYTVEEQRQRYKPIHHIQVKQLQYLSEKVTT